MRMQMFFLSQSMSMPYADVVPSVIDLRAAFTLPCMHRYHVSYFEIVLLKRNRILRVNSLFGLLCNFRHMEWPAFIPFVRNPIDSSRWPPSAFLTVAVVVDDLTPMTTTPWIWPWRVLAIENLTLQYSNFRICRKLRYSYIDHILTIVFCYRQCCLVRILDVMAEKGVVFHW